MNKLLAEQELSLSDLMDEATQIRIAKLLSAKYLVLGEIIDMGSAGLLVSVRMVNVGTGEIIWQDEKREKLALYDYMGAYFAKSLLGPLGVSAGAATVVKIEKKEEKQPEAIIKTSVGIDAYDRNDTAAAKTVLEEARALDPGSDVAAEYLAKLAVNTSKFKVMLESYYSDQNPASLAFDKTDRLYYLFNATTDTLQGLNNWLSDRSLPPELVLPDGSKLLEIDGRIKTGYSFPIADNWGFRIETFYYISSSQRTIPPVFPLPETYYWANQSGIGGLIDVGLKLNERFSVGLGVGIYYESLVRLIFFTPQEEEAHVPVSFKVGAMFKNADESLVFDMQVGYSTGLLVPRLGGIATDYLAMPLFIEGTLKYTFDGKRTFIILKQLNDICLDRPYYYGRVIPAIEHYLMDWFSLRLGGELAYAHLNASDNFGYGIVSGVSFRVGKADLDLSFGYRLRPSRWVEDVMFPEGVVTLGISLNDLFISRGK
jgi:hypothetical protein